MGVVSWTLAVSSLPFVFVCSGVSLVLVTLALAVKASPPDRPTAWLWYAASWKRGSQNI